MFVNVDSLIIALSADNTPPQNFDNLLKLILPTSGMNMIYGRESVKKIRVLAIPHTVRATRCTLNNLVISKHEIQRGSLPSVGWGGVLAY